MKPPRVFGHVDRLSRALQPPRVNIRACLAATGISPTLEANELIQKAQNDSTSASSQQLFRFSFGKSPFSVPRVLQESLRQNVHQNSYLPVMGLPKLREAIGAAHGRPMEDVIIGPGSKELLFLSLFAVYPPATVFLPVPSWVSYFPQAMMSDHHVHWVKTRLVDRFVPSSHALDMAFSTSKIGKVLILNYPNNPTGCSASPAQLQAIAAVCRKHKVLVISDEVYAHTTHYCGSATSLFTHRPPSIEEYYPEGTIVTSSISKAFGAGGWRLGYAFLPEGLSAVKNAICAAASETYSAASAPIQHASVSAFLPSRELDLLALRQRQILRLTSRMVMKTLKDACPSALAPPPDGAFYMYIDFSLSPRAKREGNDMASAEVFARVQKETGVVLLPGSVFGEYPSNPWTARLAFVDLDGEKALSMLEGREENLDKEIEGGRLDELCEGEGGWGVHMREGVRRLAEYMNS
ncbi:unnamed protein product [Vitrella brassicaformis CCMP3155]|uniref:Aminotransferase class I/classII large domain-containing protein n=1 Tax=Vitrella brassicaformis (strain CCMP3155) TaxID=1169540 RepID=A0A0G4FYI5_VITBC|nr:unnamed protein product [Vitrella brassicaformis CCMP3155]|eukprot:CEM20085.1 unnamed protein product [Vitrella brassicaformis CCMP3155]